MDPRDRAFLSRRGIVGTRAATPAASAAQRRMYHRPGHIADHVLSSTPVGTVLAQEAASNIALEKVSRRSNAWFRLKTSADAARPGEPLWRLNLPSPEPLECQLRKTIPKLRPASAVGSTRAGDGTFGPAPTPAKRPTRPGSAASHSVGGRIVAAAIATGATARSNEAPSAIVDVGDTSSDEDYKTLRTCHSRSPLGSVSGLRSGEFLAHGCTAKDIGRAHRREMNERDAAAVRALDDWRPTRTEVAAIAERVTGKYRTSKRTNTAFTIWDYAWEPPIVRDERIVAEMTRFEVDASAAGSVATERAACHMEWARSIV